MRLVTLALVLGLAATARADDGLAEATRLEAALEYDQALAIVTHLIERGTATDPHQLAELHFFAGRLAAGLDRADEARQHFAIALALTPALALPAGTSPKLLAPFEQAHATTVPLRVHATAGRDVVVDADPLALVARTEVTAAHARALDAHGNVVWAGDVPAPPPPPPAGPGLAARWSTWAVTSGAALVVGGLCAWRFQVAQDDWDAFSQDGMHDYSQLRAIERRGERWGLAADVGLGVAAAAGVTATILYVTHRPAPVIVGDRYIGVTVAF